jgi:S-layer homology domain
METAFTDMDPDDPRDLYPHDYIAAATDAGIIQGKTSSTFDPWSGVTRAQVLTMIVRSAQHLFSRHTRSPTFDLRWYP